MPPVMPKMLRSLIVKQLNYDLTPVAGLALVGHYLNPESVTSNGAAVFKSLMWLANLLG